MKLIEYTLKPKNKLFIVTKKRQQCKRFIRFYLTNNKETTIRKHTKKKKKKLRTKPNIIEK